MKAKEFVEGKDYATSKGFPVGRTTIDLETSDFQEDTITEENGNTKKINKVIIGKETFNVPMSVMKKVQEATEKGAFAVEVNRQGTTKSDTKYVSYLLDEKGKIIK